MWCKALLLKLRPILPRGFFRYRDPAAVGQNTLSASQQVASTYRSQHKTTFSISTQQTFQARISGPLPNMATAAAQALGINLAGSPGDTTS